MLYVRDCVSEPVCAATAVPDVLYVRDCVSEPVCAVELAPVRFSDSPPEKTEYPEFVSVTGVPKITERLVPVVATSALASVESVIGT